MRSTTRRSASAFRPGSSRAPGRTSASAAARAAATHPRRMRLLGAVGLPAQGARDHEADARPLIVDRAGLVVDQRQLLADRHELHLVEVALVAALPGDKPYVAGVTK